MEKKKKPTWDGKKRFYKIGEGGAIHDVYRDFTSKVWNMMVEREQAMWTTLSEADMAPISKEVIEFEEKEAEKTIIETSERVLPEIEYIDPEEAEKEKIKEQLRDLGLRYSHNSKLETLRKKLEDATNPE